MGLLTMIYCRMVPISLAVEICSYSWLTLLHQARISRLLSCSAIWMTVSYWSMGCRAGQVAMAYFLADLFIFLLSSSTLCRN